LFIQKSIKNEKAEKSGNFPQKAEEVATLGISLYSYLVRFYIFLFELSIGAFDKNLIVILLGSKVKLSFFHK
jgi:hypothetical protein